MKPSSITAVLSAVVVVGSASLARAQEHVVQKTETVTESGGPSRSMMVSGLVTFSAVYIPSIIVAATSDRSADQRLYIPFAGPWMALPNRGDCGPDTARSCNAETTYKVLLVADGVIQALGAVLFIRSFFTPGGPHGEHDDPRGDLPCRPQRGRLELRPHGDRRLLTRRKISHEGGKARAPFRLSSFMLAA